MADTPALESLPVEPVPPTRRKVLAWLIGVINAVVFFTVVGPVMGLVGGPLRRKAKGVWVPVLDDGALAVGQTREVRFAIPIKDGYQTVDRQYVLYLYRHPDQVVAIDPACTHLGCRVKFQDAKMRYFCPCHGGVFDAEGRVVSGPPPKALERHPVRIKGGKIEVFRSV
ncbi:MAG: ubiquinol-cytochrome c reductase iron-sulfur subunit [Fimbriimonadaceae bacterium]|nr:ubiquinol-cytochrome c reductase iron-sulfur subunit [Chthonomonadaceae bacterium]MCO5297462.1 ubiquinol-cytochrome c reductase iron-sulfur subunit [Fimbriimonadaceae bacterium]